jgi:uncharacterized protein (TIGR02246 family)
MSKARKTKGEKAMTLNKFLAVGIFLTLSAVASVFAQDKAKFSAAAAAKISRDEAAVRQIVKRVEDGWNAKSGRDFAAPFASDADYVVVNGMHIKGREAIEQGHAQIFSTVYKDSRNAATIKSVRFLRPDVAVAHVEWNLVYRHEGKESKMTAMNTMFLTKEKGLWTIAAFHNTPVRAAEQMPNR